MPDKEEKKKEVDHFRQVLERRKMWEPGTGAPNEIIVQNLLNIALFNVF